MVAAPHTVLTAGEGLSVWIRIHDNKSPSKAFDWSSVAIAWSLDDIEGTTGSLDLTWYGEYLWRATIVPPWDGTLTWTVCATDAAGNEGCGEEQNTVLTGFGDPPEPAPDPDPEPEPEAESMPEMSDSEVMDSSDGGADVVDATDAGPDADDDAGPDVSPDADEDADPDASPDVSPDVSPDASPDADVDSGDATGDSGGETDTGPDTAPTPTPPADDGCSAPSETAGSLPAAAWALALLALVLFRRRRREDHGV